MMPVAMRFAVPTGAPVQSMEQIMLSNDKLFVVLAVVLLIWFGLVVLILRTDRRLSALERTLDARAVAPTRIDQQTV